MKQHQKGLVLLLVLGVSFILPLAIQKFMIWFSQQEPLVSLAIIGTVIFGCSLATIFMDVMSNIDP